jgi:hypothetical protein
MSVALLTEAASYVGTTCKYTWATRFPTPTHFTAMCWGYLTGNSATYYDLFTTTDDGDVIALAAKLSGGNYFLNIGDLPSDSTSARSFTRNEWHHFAMTVQPNGANNICNAYLDGILQVGPVNMQAPPISGATKFQFWNTRASDDDAGAQWVGYLAAFKCWDNVALNPTEIRREMRYWRAVRRQGLFTEVPCYDLDSRALETGGTAMGLATVTGTFVAGTRDPPGVLRDLPARPVRVSDGSGPSALAGNTSLAFSPTGVLTGAGALAGASTLTFSPSAALTGSGALVGASTITFSPSAAIQGIGALTGASTLTFAPSAALTGAGALTGATTLTFSPSAALTGTGALTGSATVTFSVAGTLADAGSGSLAGSSSLTFTLVGALTGAGDLAGSATLTFSPAGELADASAPPVTPIGPSTGGGGGGIDYQRVKRTHRRPHKELKSLLDEALPEVYAELTQGPKQVATQARAIIEPYRAASTVDWAALESDASAVGRLLALVGAQRSAQRAEAKRAALQAHDENWFLMS